MRNAAARRFTLLTLWFAVLALAAAPRAAAQEGEGDDPPSRAARLSYTTGSVSFEPSGTEDWVSAVINRPMTTGDKLWTDRDGRAELRVDSYALRLGPQTGFSFLNLDDRTVQIRLTEGSLNIRVRRLDENQTLEVDTPNLAFNVLRPGSYRVNVNENGDATIISIRDGQGEVTGGGSAYPVHAGQTASFSGTDQLSADVQSYGSDDDFDRWCADRDRRWDRSTAPRYVSDDVVGYEDLDDYGGWRPVPEYGTVWFPHTTVVGWAPYRYGHWVWISPWGWTWVDDAPWGFAPFHYGRWVVVGGVWGWVPCPPRPAVYTVAYVRPVYAPALVAWVGGPRWGVGVSVGGVAAGVAWFPLGPRDVFCPAYRVSPRYVENVNVSNTVIINRTQVTNVYNNVYVNKTVNVTNITYQNQRVNNAVTATSQASFTSAQPIGRNMIRVDAREVSAAPVAPLTPGVAPQQRSFLGAGADARVRPPSNVYQRPVVARTAPPPAAIPVSRQIQDVQANGGRPVSAAQIRPPQEAPRPNVRVAPPVRTTTMQTPGNNRPAMNNPIVANGPINSNRPTTAPSANNQPQPNNAPNNGGVNNGNARNYNDRPPTSRPNVDPALQQKQQQEIERLRQQQDLERQKFEQKQMQQQNKVQNQNNPQRQQSLEQKQQAQLDQMERKHDQEQQKLEQKQQKEIQRTQGSSNHGSNASPKPPKNENKDRPH